jgi:hypothetical protein
LICTPEHAAGGVLATIGQQLHPVATAIAESEKDARLSITRSARTITALRPAFQPLKIADGKPVL